MHSGCRIQLWRCNGIMAKQALLVFQKNPVKGKVKTRLAVTLGEEKALQIYQFLLNKTFDQIRKTKHEVFVFFSDFLPEDHPEPGHHLVIQKGNDLGERMRIAFEEVFSLGYEKAVIIGTDCPEITDQILNKAFDFLNHVDLVIGSAADGGYYLLGMKNCHSYLFQGMEWSTSQVFLRTLEKAKEHHLSTKLLPELHDIDEAEDWKRFITQFPEYE